MSLPRLLAVAALLAAGTVTLGPASPAAAAIPGAELVWSAPTSSSSETTRSIAASCPSGKRVLGAFAYIAGNERDVLITSLIPTSTAAIAIAREDQDGTTDNWQVVVQLICANPVPGHTIVSTTSASTSANKQVTAACPAGTRLLTTGWSLGGSDGEVFLNGVSQAADLSGVSITGMEDQDGHDGAWRLTTYAVCATPLPGLELINRYSAVDSADKSVLMLCGEGRQRLSMGWSLIGSGGGTPAGQVLAGLGSAGTGWFEVTAHEDDDGYANPWYLVGRIVCVTV